MKHELINGDLFDPRRSKVVLTEFVEKLGILFEVSYGDH